MLNTINQIFTLINHDILLFYSYEPKILFIFTPDYINSKCPFFPIHSCMKTFITRRLYLIFIYVLPLIVLSCEKDKEKPDDNTIKDADGNEYTSVIIGDQEWLTSNLKTTKYADGSNIDYPGTDTTSWRSNTTGAYAWLNSDEVNKNRYGALYNWYAVTNSRGLCPQGWRVSSNNDWQQLLTYLTSANGWTNLADDFTGIGNRLKSCLMLNSPRGGDCAASLHPRWHYHADHVGTDDVGFSALPGGNRSGDRFSGMGAYGFWWCNNEATTRIAINYDKGRVYTSSNFPKYSGFSVRCIKE
jgi:uncharacterized protein (TIGR02145 family)